MPAVHAGSGENFKTSRTPIFSLVWHSLRYIQTGGKDTFGTSLLNLDNILLFKMKQMTNMCLNRSFYPYRYFSLLFLHWFDLQVFNDKLFASTTLLMNVYVWEFLNNERYGGAFEAKVKSSPRQTPRHSNLWEIRTKKGLEFIIQIHNIAAIFMHLNG